MQPLRDPKSSQSQNDPYLDMVAAQASSAQPSSAEVPIARKNSVFACLKEKIEAQQVADRRYLATGLACFDTALSGGWRISMCI